MPRSGPSRTDTALIAAAAERGVHVSPYQLERWRASGDLPRNQRRGLGRGRGSVSQPPPETVEQVCVLGRLAKQGRPDVRPDPLVQAALHGSDEDVRRLIHQPLRHLSTLLRADRDDSDPESGFAARYDAATAMARRAGRSHCDAQDLVNALIEALKVDGVAVQPVLAPASLRGRTAIVQAIAAGAEETVVEDIVGALAETFASSGILAEDLYTARVGDELAGTSQWDEALDFISVRKAQQLTDTVPADLLRRSVLALTLAQAGTWMFLLVVVPFDPDRRDVLLREILHDPMWQYFRAIPPPRLGRHGDLFAARWAPLLATAPTLLAKTERFGNRLLQIVEAAVNEGKLEQRVI